MNIYKKGDMKYDTIGTLILGLLVLAIGFFWIFSSVLSPENLDWEICRDSLIARNGMPEGELGVMISTKGLLDLKCKTQVVTIDYNDTAEAEKIIGETISSCWYMIGRGDYKVFPGSGGIIGPITEKATPCMMCARIHMDSEVREFYSEEKNQINLKRTLENPLEGYDVSVWDYLNPDRGAQAITYFNEWNDTGFSVKKIKDYSIAEFNPEDTEIFSLPKYFLPAKGDLFITYAEPISGTIFSNDRAIDPYLFFLQADDFDLINEVWAVHRDIIDTTIHLIDKTNELIDNIIKFPESVLNMPVDECDDCIKVCSSIESVPS